MQTETGRPLSGDVKGCCQRLIDSGKRLLLCAFRPLAKPWTIRPVLPVGRGQTHEPKVQQAAPPGVHWTASTSSDTFIVTDSLRGETK